MSSSQKQRSEPNVAAPVGSCKHCGASTENQCSRCKTIFYCSVPCQKADRKRHKQQECVRLTSTSSPKQRSESDELELELEEPFGDCKHCGAFAATSKCSRCKTTFYCSVTCQRADWKRHKKEECAPKPVAGTITTGSDCGTSSSSSSLLPPNFDPFMWLICLHCRKACRFCMCPESARKDMLYALDPIPEEYTMMQRIQRWAELISYHPLFSKFDAKRFVKDFEPTFPQDMEILQPIIEKQMKKYKENGLIETVKKLGIVTAQGFEQCRKDCDYVMEHYFKGNWSYPCHLEYIFLYNAIQQSGPEEFDQTAAKRFQNVVGPVDFCVQIMKMLGVQQFEYRLEEIANFDGPRF